MTEQRNSRIALLAVTMLLSGALLGLVMSDDSSASKHDVVGFVNTDGVEVTIIDASSGDKKAQSSAVDGSFSFDELDSGNYMVRYSKEGYLSHLDSWDIPADLPLSGTVTLSEVQEGATTISGNVTNSDDEAIEGAFVYLMNNTLEEDSWWPNVTVGYTVSTVTDADGNFSFSNVTSGDYAVRVEAAGYYTQYNVFDEPNHDPWEITLDAHSDDNKQTIRVYDDAGNPLGDASVFMYDLDTSTWTDAEKYGGFSYLLKPATGSDVYVYAYHADHKPAVKKIDSVSGTDSFDMTLDQNHESSKDVVYISTEPSEGAQSAAPLKGDRLVKLNPGPTASISEQDTYVIGLGDTLNLSASSSTAPVGIASYAWTGGQVTEDYSNTFDSEGSNDITLTVTDEFGQTNDTTVTVIVDGKNPVASFTSLSKDSPSENGTAVNDTNVNEDYTTVVFNASASSDSESSVSSYHWDFGDGTTNTGEVVSHVFDNPGTFSVTLNVTDAAGNYNAAFQSVKVNDVTPPNAAFNFSYEQDGEVFEFSSLEGVPTKFDAGLSTDNSDDALTYNWEFGDGNTSEGKVVEHTFSAALDEGYDVKLTVTDSSGQQDITSQKVTPSEKDRPDLYVSSLVFSNDNPEEGDTVEMTATLKLLGMNITSPFEVGFYLDSPTGTLIDTVMVDGSNMTMGIDADPFNVTASWKAISGAHTIYVIADDKDAIDESNEKNELTAVITVSAEDDSRDVTSIILIVAVVLLSVGAVGYIYRDSLFNN